MKPKPLILLPYNNNGGERLKWLDEEVRTLARLTSDHDRCAFKSLTAVQMGDIRAEFRRDTGHIKIFHFSGHGDNRGLQLSTGNTYEQTLFAQGLAELLAHEEAINLVFLNACATSAQIEYFLKANIKVVIGTRRPIQDDYAFIFAKVFYEEFLGGRTIQQAFDRAHTALKTDLGELKQEKLYRDLINIGGSAYDNWQQPYEIRALEPEYLNHTLQDWYQTLNLPQQSSHLTATPPKTYFNCNRDTHKEEFEDIYKDAQHTKPRQAQFIFVQGTEEEAPDRLGTCLIRHHLPRELAPLNIGDSITGPTLLETQLKHKDLNRTYERFCKNLQQNFQAHDPNQQSIQELLLEQGRQHDLVWIEHTFHMDEWHPHLESILQRYITEYWDFPLTDQYPQIYIFCYFKLQAENRFSLFGSRSKAIKAAIAELARLNNCHLMPDLQAVGKAELEYWCDIYKLNSPDLEKAIFHIFGNRSKVALRDLHNHLAGILDEMGRRDYQQQPKALPTP